MRLTYIQIYSETSNNELSSFREIARYSICSSFNLNFPIRNNENTFNPFRAPKIINLKYISVELLTVLGVGNVK